MYSLLQPILADTSAIAVAGTIAAADTARAGSRYLIVMTLFLLIARKGYERRRLCSNHAIASNAPISTSYGMKRMWCFRVAAPHWCVACTAAEHANVGPRSRHGRLGVVVDDAKA